MEINKAKYDELIDKIGRMVFLYKSDTNLYKDNNYLLYLANGDTISYRFNDNNLPHLLGIDFTPFITRNEMTKENSFSMLNQLLDNSYKYWNIISSNMKPSDVFSNFFEDKVNNFQKQISIPYPNQIYFVCKYDKSKTYGIKEVDGLSADYYIARKNEEGDIVLLGLVKNNDNIYIPQTSRIIKNNETFMEEMDKFLYNQEITYPTGLYINNYITKFSNNYSLNIFETIDTLNRIEDLSSTVSAVPNTIDGHIYNLKSLSKSRNQSYGSKTILYNISSKMKEKEIITLSNEEMEILDSSLIEVINAYNDSLFKDNNSKNNIYYTDILNEKRNLALELEEKNTLIEEQKEELLKLRTALQEKENESSEFKNVKEKLLEITKNF